MLEILIQQLIDRGRIGATEGYSLEYLMDYFQQQGLPVKIDRDELVLANIETPFDKEMIASHLHKTGEASPCTIEIHRVIESTNDYLAQTVKGDTLPLICLAEYQTKGHGRRGNYWASSYGTDICCSVAWQVPIEYQVSGVESLIIALALIDALERIGLNEVEVKWPNDIYIKGKKIAGILLEQLPNSDRSILIVGIGLNMMERYHDNESRNFQATSIEDEIGRRDRNQVTAILIQETVQALNSLNPRLSEALMIKWKNHDYLRGKEIEIEQNRVLRGRYQGIDKQGRLLLKTSDDLIEITSGHITEISQ